MKEFKKVLMRMSVISGEFSANWALYNHNWHELCLGLNPKKVITMDEMKLSPYLTSLFPSSTSLNL